MFIQYFCILIYNTFVSADINNSWNDTNYIPETTSPTTASIAIPPTTKETRIKNLSTTARPVIVLVSVPERRRNVEKDRQKFATKDVFLRHVQNDESIDVPNVDYVKTVHKGIIFTEIFLKNIYKYIISPLLFACDIKISLYFFTRLSLSLCIRYLLKQKYFYFHDRRYTDIYANSVGHRSNCRGYDRLPRSDLACGGYDSSYAFQTVRDCSSCHLRRREDQKSRTRKRKQR